MNKIDQILAFIKSINEKLNSWIANAKKVEELPEMEVVNSEALMMVSELEEGIWTSKKLEIQKIIDGISLAGQNNTLREILLGEITDEHDLEYLFDNNAISVAPTELVILIVLQTISAKQIQRQFLWKLGKGDFAPIGSSDLNTKVLELQPKFINEIIADELTAAPDAIVYDFGTITDPIIDVINVSTPVFDFSNDEKIYYIRFTKDDIKYLYNFVGVDGEYGDSALQMVESDLVLVYSSEIIDVISLIEGKLDKDGFSGTAQDLNLRIGVLEGAQGKGNRFTGKSYALWSSTGLTYNVVYTSYYLNDILYPGGIMPKTLTASDPTNPRFDTIAVDATGPIVITGTPSASPEVPSTDPNTQLAITSVLVQAGATTPAGVSNEDIYKENAEWTAVSNNGTVDFNATTTPFQGSKHIDCGAFTNGQYLRFTDSVVNQIADFTEIGITPNLKSVFSNSTKFSVRFYNGTTAVSSTVVISSGAYNFDRTIVNAYQMVILPISAFTFTSSSFDRIEIVMNGSNANGFRMDNIILYKGSGSASPEQNAITSIITDSGIVNATQKDDAIQLIGGLGIDITSSGKVITISGTTDLSDYYTKSETDTALGLKVDKDGSKVLSDNNYSTSEKNKLASIDATHYLPPLQTTAQLSALPQASVSDKARVYVENELSDYFYDATASSGDIAPDDQTGGVGFWKQVAVGGETAASIKTKYESNPDTNAFTDAEQAKLSAISGTNTGNETATTIATINHGATVKTTLVDADEITGQDSASSFGLIRVTCLNLYNYLKTKFDSIYQVVLTDSVFGTFINSLTGKTTPVDADSISIVDSADSNKQKKVSLTNFKAFLKTYFDTLYSSSSLGQISITTSVSITTATTDGSGNTQYGKHVLIKNGVNNINITVNGVSTTPTTYQKEGTGTITFVQGSGRTLRQVDGTAILNGAVGSTATLASDVTIDSLRISNA